MSTPGIGPTAPGNRRTVDDMRRDWEESRQAKREKDKREREQLAAFCGRVQTELLKAGYDHRARGLVGLDGRDHTAAGWIIALAEVIGAAGRVLVSPEAENL